MNAYDLGLKSAALRPGRGIPDPTDLGNISQLKPGLYPYVVQRHLAERAGLHHDLRFGKDKMYSWAVPKLVPAPGEKRLAVQQPLHMQPYMHFQGRLKGYGAGEVKTEDKGQILVTKVSDDEIKYTIAHSGIPQRFVLKRMGDGKNWLLINSTPTAGPEWPKPKYRKVDSREVDKLFRPGMSIEAKLDGARMLGKVLKDRIELISYRPRAGSGGPIVHTERVFGSSPMKVPPGLEGTEFVGELIGTRGGKAIPAQELSGLLNASIAKSLMKQREGNIKLKMAIFDILKGTGSGIPRQYRAKVVADLAKKLGGPFFTLPAVPGESPKAKKMWEDIITGQHPLTGEGIVAWPGEGVPTKVKAYPESDVYIRSIFPEARRGLAGGFEYSLTPGGDIVGRVGTGFDRPTKIDMYTNPEEWLNRKARIRAQEKFPSGAYRAPAFISRHEG